MPKSLVLPQSSAPFLDGTTSAVLSPFSLEQDKDLSGDVAPFYYLLMMLLMICWIDAEEGKEISKKF